MAQPGYIESALKWPQKVEISIPGAAISYRALELSEEALKKLD